MTAATASSCESTLEAFEVAAGFHGTMDADAGIRVYTAADVAAAHGEWLTGVVDWAHRSGRIALDDEASTMLDSLMQRSLIEAVTLESRAVATVKALTEHGIESRVLKGVAVAHLDYFPAEARLFGDVDLLVRGSDMTATVRMLGDVGFHRRFPEPCNGYDEVVGKGVAVEDLSRSVIDLHRTLALGYFGTRLPIERLWDEADVFELCGHEVAALSRVDRVVHCSLHLALAPVAKRVNGLDLCVIARRSQDVSTDDIISTATDWRCRAPLAIAIRSTCDWFGSGWAPEGLVQWAHDYRPTLGERVALTSYTGRLANSRWRSVTALAGLPTSRARKVAVRAMFVGGAKRGG